MAVTPVSTALDAPSLGDDTACLAGAESSQAL
jgi:hypothetical protein